MQGPARMVRTANDAQARRGGGGGGEGVKQAMMRQRGRSYLHLESGRHGSSRLRAQPQHRESAVSRREGRGLGRQHIANKDPSSSPFSSLLLILLFRRLSRVHEKMLHDSLSIYLFNVAAWLACVITVKRAREAEDKVSPPSPSPHCRL